MELSQINAMISAWGNAYATSPVEDRDWLVAILLLAFDND